MANEITFGYASARTLTYGAYQPDGTVRTAAGTSLAEVGTTGYYKATDANVAAGDAVIVKDGLLGVVGWGQYQPAATLAPDAVNAGALAASALTEIQTACDSAVSANADIDQIVADVAALLDAAARTSVFDETGLPEVAVIRNM